MMYKIKITWDNEACVWIAVSDELRGDLKDDLKNDLKGFVLECESLDKLIERIKVAIPELLEIQGEKSEKILEEVSEISLNFSLSVA